MGRYAVFSTKDWYGPSREELGRGVPVPPVAGAVAEGEFWPYGGGEPGDACTRWVLDVPDLESLGELSRSLGRELIVATMPYGRYDNCGPELWDGIDGIVEIYDGWRE